MSALVRNCRHFVLLAAVAQSGEQMLCKQQVAGSSPAGGSISLYPAGDGLWAIPPRR